jgi:hypothetical protein
MGFLRLGTAIHPHAPLGYSSFGNRDRITGRTTPKEPYHQVERWAEKEIEIRAHKNINPPLKKTRELCSFDGISLTLQDKCEIIVTRRLR